MFSKKQKKNLETEIGQSHTSGGGVFNNEQNPQVVEQAEFVKNNLFKASYNMKIKSINYHLY